MCRSVLNKSLIKLRILDLSGRRGEGNFGIAYKEKDYRVISVFFVTADRAADAATVCKVCYPNEFSLCMTFNSRNMGLFWQLQLL